MPKIHVVGKEGSFTWLASVERYGKDNRLIGGYGQQDLLKKLSRERKDRIKDPSVVPIWNSNFGTVEFNKKMGEDLTAGTLKGAAGNIIDVWGRRIKFILGVHGSELAKNGTVYSVAVAEAQCSDFFDKYGGITFDGCKTTNIACRKFLSNKKDGNGLLCSIELLERHKIHVIKDNFTNSFNYTVFFGLNQYPSKKKIIPKVSLGCFLMDLQGQNELPMEFLEYWNDITKAKDISEAKNIIQVLPKINFILRFEQSRALVLVEMPARRDLANPWVGTARDSPVELLGQVGLLKKSFTFETCDLIKSFRGNRQKAIFYGKDREGRCFWSCPTLKIVMHGFEAGLVRNCARIQVRRLSNLFKDGLKFPDEAKIILGQFPKNEKLLKLAEDSKPEDH